MRSRSASDASRWRSIYSVSSPVRDGPNVQQAYDAAWVDWELAPWRFITFWSHPVQYRHKDLFDDLSARNLQYGGFRIERQKIGPGSLSAYYSRFMQDDVRFIDATGDERRNIIDARYAGEQSGFDWDLEAMGQFGAVGGKRVRAWAIGTLTGYTFSDLSWAPRLGLQFDAASGDRHPGDGSLETFNPLFPNGYYFTLAGYTGYVNLFHLKPSLTVKPISNVKLLAALGLSMASDDSGCRLRSAQHPGKRDGRRRAAGGRAPTVRFVASGRSRETWPAPLRRFGTGSVTLSGVQVVTTLGT